MDVCLYVGEGLVLVLFDFGWGCFWLKC